MTDIIALIADAADRANLPALAANLRDTAPPTATYEPVITDNGARLVVHRCGAIRKIRADIYNPNFRRCRECDDDTYTPDEWTTVYRKVTTP